MPLRRPDKSYAYRPYDSRWPAHAAYHQDKLVFLTDVDGVRDASGNLLPYLSSVEAEALVSAGVATGGMVPKINACLEAVNHNTHTCIIDSRKPHVLLDYVDGRESGTIINRP